MNSMMLSLPLNDGWGS